ncbi:acetate/propionate family kinase [Petrachloros mirabilis]
MKDLGSGPFILTVNGGSSSLKFALYGMNQRLSCVLRGLIDRIAIPESAMIVTDESNGRSEKWPVDVPDHQVGAALLIDWLEQRAGFQFIRGIGHRVVHGGPKYSEPEVVTSELLGELRRISPYDPEHMPAEIALIESFMSRWPNVMHVACFDTAFHRDIPRVAQLLAIPRRYEKEGLRRYGFHGLSCAYLMKELARLGGEGEANGRVILAHLGNGSSMTAVKRGKSLDTTMGFTPTAGLPMSRRSGDIDPGIVSYLARTEGMSVEQFHRMVNTESGLLGISELSSDMRDLLSQEARDSRAAEAVAVYCYHAKKTIGALSAAMGGLDTLVFSAGIGENSPVVRARICDRLDFLGVSLDEAHNNAGQAVISQAGSRVTVRVIHTDEERELAQMTVRRLSGSGD